MEILANLDDINAHLDQNVAVATDENTALLQVATARIVRGNLFPVVDQVTLQSWRTPEQTPEIIREIAGMLIAARHYFNEWSKTSNIIDADSYPQKLYDNAMALLKGVIDGTIVIIDIPIETTGDLSIEDFFPVDATNRAFTLGMEL